MIDAYVAGIAYGLTIAVCIGFMNIPFWFDVVDGELVYNKKRGAWLYVAHAGIFAFIFTLFAWANVVTR